MEREDTVMTTGLLLDMSDEWLGRAHDPGTLWRQPTCLGVVIAVTRRSYVSKNRNYVYLLTPRGTRWTWHG